MLIKCSVYSIYELLMSDRLNKKSIVCHGNQHTMTAPMTFNDMALIRIDIQTCINVIRSYIAASAASVCFLYIKDTEDKRKTPTHTHL